jgi:tetratricopeptide (TPR) repeat protein
MNPRDLFVKAERSKRRGDLTESLRLYLKVIELDPNCVGAYFNAAAILFRMRRYPEATQLYEKGLRLSPRNLSALLDAAKACEMMGRWDEALRYLDEAISIRPSSEVALRRRRRIAEEKRAFGSLRDHMADLAQFLEKTRREYSERFRVDLPSIEVEIAERVDLPNAPGWSSGMYDERMRVIVRDFPDPGLMAAIIRHEYAHLALRTVCGGRLPGWLEEGVAEYLSKGLPDFERERLRETALKGNLISLNRLDDMTDLPDEEVRLAYIQSCSAVEYLISSLGWEVFLSFLKSAADEGVDRAMRSYLGVNLEEFEVKWMEEELSRLR